MSYRFIIIHLSGLNGNVGPLDRVSFAPFSYWFVYIRKGACLLLIYRDFPATIFLRDRDASMILSERVNIRKWNERKQLL